MAKATNKIAEQRIKEISFNLSRGMKATEVIEYAIKNWGISKPQVYKYIQKVRAKWDEVFENNFIYDVNWHLDARLTIYEKCMKKEDLTNARQILNDIADIQGIERNRAKLEHSGNIKLDVEAMMDRWAETAARLEAKKQGDDGADG
jgi:hypothetical protein